MAPRLNRVVTVVFCRAPKFSSFGLELLFALFVFLLSFLILLLLVVIFVEFLVLGLVFSTSSSSRSLVASVLFVSTLAYFVKIIMTI